MRLVTEFELATTPKDELYGLLREAYNLASSSNPHSIAHRDALLQIENIRKEIAQRHPHI